MSEGQASRRSLLKLVGLGAGAAAFPGPLLAEAARGVFGGGSLSASRTLPFRVGAWLPSDQAVLDRWMEDLIKTVDANPSALHPVVEEFNRTIDPQHGSDLFFGFVKTDLCVGVQLQLMIQILVGS